MHLKPLKEMQNSKLGMQKGYHRRYMEVVFKFGEGLDLGAKPPRIKLG